MPDELQLNKNTHKNTQRDPASDTKFFFLKLLLLLLLFFYSYFPLLVFFPLPLFPLPEARAAPRRQNAGATFDLWALPSTRGGREGREGSGGEGGEGASGATPAARDVASQTAGHA